MIADDAIARRGNYGADPIRFDPGFGVPQGFGKNWEVFDEGDYYAQTMEWVENIPDTDDVVAFRVFSNNEGIKRITPGGAGVEVWAATPFANMETSGTRRGQAQCTSTKAFVSYRFGATYRLSRIDVATGSVDWSATVVNVSSHACCLHPTTNRVFAPGSGSASGMRTFDGNAASTPTGTLYTLTGAGSVRDNIITSDGSALVTICDNELVQIRLLSGDPGSGAWAADVEVDLTADLSTPWATLNAEAWMKNGPGDTFWIAANGHEEVYKLDTSGAELVKVEPLSDLGATTGGIRGIATDKFFDLYPLWEGGAPNENHVLRYLNAGDIVTSTQLQGLTLTDTTQPADIDVTTEGSIWIANMGAAGSGSLTRIAQS